MLAAASRWRPASGPLVPSAHTSPQVVAPARECARRDGADLWPSYRAPRI